MQNASFESVGVGTGFTGTTWPVLEPATTHVPPWTRASPSSGGPQVYSGGFPLPPAFHGSKMAAVSRLQGLVGTLSTSTGVGATYVLSVQVQTLSPATPTTVELLLRNSTTGAQSVPLVQTSTTQVGSWVLFTGTVTSSAPFDRVLLTPRSAQAFFDDARICLAVGPTSVVQHGWWTLSRVAAASVGGAVLTAGLVAALRRRRKA